MRKTLPQTILAAFSAILACATLEGGGVMLIGMRNAMLSGSGKLSAKSYVQDGLIAMWDGIENAGWGKHVDGSANWIDLIHEYTINKTVGGHPFKILGNAFICTGSRVANNEAITSVDAAFFSSFNNSADYTFEALQGDVVDSSYGSITATIGNSTNVFSRGFVLGNSTKAYIRTSHGTSWPSPECILTPGPGVWFKTTTVVNNGRIRGFVNGNELGYPTPPPEAAEVAADRIWISRANAYKMLRLYSRALTAAEIAANYAVDAARFNLPAAT